MGEVVFPRDEYTNQLFTAKWSALKIYIQIISSGQSRYYLVINKHTQIYMSHILYMSAVTITEKEVR